MAKIMTENVKWETEQHLEIHPRKSEWAVPEVLLG
jgi:hypothetical protein